MKTKHFLTTVLFFIISFWNNSMFGQPLQISIHKQPPHLPHFDSFDEVMSDVFITVMNTSNVAVEYNLKIHATGPNGLTLDKENFLDNPLTIAANSVRNFTGEDWDGSGANITEDDVSPESERQFLLLNRVFREGEYCICLTAIVPNHPNQELSNPTDGCTCYNIVYADAPIIETPEMNQVLTPLDPPLVNIAWTHSVPGAPSTFDYSLKVIDITTQTGISPIELIEQSSIPVVFEEEEMGLLMMALTDVDFEEGHSYAARVTVTDPDGEIQFINAGKSNVVVFQYGIDPDGSDCTDLSSYSVNAHYPVNGDTIPFTMFPLVINFDPNCPEYWKFQFNANFNGSTRSDDNTWQNGALDYIQRRYGDESIGWDQASKLPVYDVASTNRGDTYAWNTSTTMRKRNGENWSSSVPSTSFVVGMPIPRLSFPDQNDTVTAGNIDFRWKIGEGQTRLIPKFNLSHFSGSDGTTHTRMSDVDEHWVVQIFTANEANAANLQIQRNSRIQVPIDDLYSGYQFDEARLRQLLNRSISQGIEITSPGEYWWRVVWLKDPTSNPGTSFVGGDNIYHESPLRKFIIVEGTPSEEPHEEPSGDCVSGAEAPVVTDLTATSGLVVGDILNIGLFSMEVTEITAENGSTFSGNGEIKINFLNNLRVSVAFTNIQKNASKQIFSGTVKAKEDRHFSTSGVATTLGQAVGMSVDDAAQLDDYLNTGERLISILGGSRAIGLPIGIDNEVGENEFVIAILSMEFTTEHASLMAVANVDIPSLDGYYLNIISLGVSDMLFSPQGLGREGKAFLPREIRLVESDGSELVLGGLENAGTNWNQVTYVEWNCNGFKCLNLALDFKFSRDVIVPDNPDGSPGAGQVIAHSNLRICDGGDLVARIDIPPFQVTDSPDGFAFEIDEAWIDLSTTENPTDFLANLPENYTNSQLSSSEERLQNMWTGLWLKDLRLRIPEYAGNLEGEAQRTMSVSIHNFIYDGDLTFSFRVQNVLSLTENKNIEGSAFSIDTIYMDVLQSSFTEAGMKGKIGLPIADDREYLNYKLVFDHDNNTDTLQFIIVPEDSLTFPILIARAQIAPTSNFKLTILPSIEFSFDINAIISLSENNSGGATTNALNMNAPGIKIEHFAYSSKTGFDSQNFRFSQASPQKSMSGFPLSLDTLFLSLNGFNPSVSIKPRLTIMSGSDGVSAAAQVTIVGGLETNADGEKKIKIMDVRLDAINLDVSISTVRLKGSLEFYKTDTDKGTRGILAIELPSGIKAELSAEFGARKMPGATTYGSAQWFDYWYVDGIVTFGTTGITVFSGLQLYGLGGGVSHNMTRSGSMPPSSTVQPSTTHATRPSSGLTYTPSYDIGLGLKFTALFGAPGGGKTYNFDVSLLAEFDRSGGMTMFGFKGNVRVLADNLSDRDVPILGYVSMEYHNPSNTADGEEHVEGALFVVVDGFGVIKGAGSIENPPADYTGPRENAFVWASFYASMNRDYWFYHMGTPDRRGGLKVTIGDMDLVTFTTYLMIGYDIPTTIPPPSDAFMNIYNVASGDFSGGGDVSSLLAGQARPSLPLGEGFALGAAFSVNLSANPIPFYFELDLAMGFDINLTHSESRTCAEYGHDPAVPQYPGEDNWYAQGQFYAGIRGEFGLKVDLWFIKAEVPIFEAAAALVMQGGLPNPTWATGDGRISYSVLNGLFKGSYHFEAELGHKCTPTVSSSDVLSGFDIIQDLKPTGNNVNVYSVMSAAFAIGVNEILEIPISETEIKRFRPFISNWQLKQNSLVVNCNPIKMGDDNVTASMLPVDILNGNTNYTQKLEVKAYELFTNRPQKLVKQSNGADWKEYRSTSFRTGPAPTVVEEENILFTYPLKLQRNFLKGETEGNFGYIVQRQGTPSVFPGYGAMEFQEFEYIARFLPIGAPDDDLGIDVPLVIDAHRVIKFDVSQLVNDQPYCVQIIQKKIEDQHPSSIISSLGTDITNYSLINAPIHALVSQANLMGLQLTSDVIKRRALPGTTTRSHNEKLLYKYYFKTSEYNTFRQKAGQEDWNTNFSSTFFGEMIKFTGSWAEEPERYDRYGYSKSHRGGTYQVPKLIKLSINTAASELDENGFPEYPVNPYLALQMKYIGNPILKINRTLSANELSTIHHYRTNYSNYLFMGGNFREPLSVSELNRLHNPTSGSPMGIAGIGMTSIFSNSISMGLLNSNPLGLATTRTVQVSHALHLAGVLELSQAKRTVSSRVYRNLPNISNNIFNIMISNPSNQPPWVQKYITKYGATAFLRIQSRPKVKDFLHEFYSSGARSTDIVMRRLLTRNLNVMRYPRQGNRIKPVTFIMSYQFPSANSSVTSSNAFPIRGTHFRVNSGYITP